MIDEVLQTKELQNLHFVKSDSCLLCQPNDNFTTNYLKYHAEDV